MKIWLTECAQRYKERYITTFLAYQTHHHPLTHLGSLYRHLHYKFYKIYLNILSHDLQLQSTLNSYIEFSHANTPLSDIEMLWLALV